MDNGGPHSPMASSQPGGGVDVSPLPPSVKSTPKKPKRSNGQTNGTNESNGHTNAATVDTGAGEESDEGTTDRKSASYHNASAGTAASGTAAGEHVSKSSIHLRTVPEMASQLSVPATPPVTGARTRKVTIAATSPVTVPAPAHRRYDSTDSVTGGSGGAITGGVAVTVTAPDGSDATHTQSNGGYEDDDEGSASPATIAASPSSIIAAADAAAVRRAKAAAASHHHKSHHTRYNSAEDSAHAKWVMHASAPLSMSSNTTTAMTSSTGSNSGGAVVSVDILMSSPPRTGVSQAAANVASPPLLAPSTVSNMTTVATSLPFHASMWRTPSVDELFPDTKHNTGTGTGTGTAAAPLVFRSPLPVAAAPRRVAAAPQPVAVASSNGGVNPSSFITGPIPGDGDSPPRAVTSPASSSSSAFEDAEEAARTALRESILSPAAPRGSGNGGARTPARTPVRSAKQSTGSTASALPPTATAPTAVLNGKQQILASSFLSANPLHDDASPPRSPEDQQPTAAAVEIAATETARSEFIAGSGEGQPKGHSAPPLHPPQPLFTDDEDDVSGHASGSGEGNGVDERGPTVVVPVSLSAPSTSTAETQTLPAESGGDAVLARTRAQLQSLVEENERLRAEIASMQKTLEEAKAHAEENRALMQQQQPTHEAENDPVIVSIHESHIETLKATIEQNDKMLASHRHTINEQHLTAEQNGAHINELQSEIAGLKGTIIGLQQQLQAAQQMQTTPPPQSQSQSPKSAPHSPSPNRQLSQAIAQKTALLSKLNEVSATLKLEAQKHAALQCANEELTARLQQLNIHYQPVYAELDTVKNEYAACQTRELAAQQQITALAARVKAAESGNETLKEQLAAHTRDEQSRHANELKAATAARVAAEQALSESQAIVSQLRVAASAATAAAEDAAAASRTAELEAKHATELSGLRDRVSAVEAERKTASEQLRTATEQVKTANEQLKGLKSSNQKETIKLTKELESVQSQLTESRSSIESLNKRLREAQSSAESGAAKRKAVVTRHETEIAELKRTHEAAMSDAVAELTKQLDGARAQLRETESELNAARVKADAAALAPEPVKAGAGAESGSVDIPTPATAKRGRSAAPVTSFLVTPQRKSSAGTITNGSVTPSRSLFQSTPASSRGPALAPGSVSRSTTTVSIAVPLPVLLTAEQHKQLADAGYDSTPSADGKTSIVSAPLSTSHSASATPARGASSSLEMIPASPALESTSAGSAATPGLDVSTLLQLQQSALQASGSDASGSSALNDTFLRDSVLQRLPSVTLVSNTYNTTTTNNSAAHTTNATSVTTAAAAARRRSSSMGRRLVAAVLIFVILWIMFWLDAAAWNDGYHAYHNSYWHSIGGGGAPHSTPPESGEQHYYYS